ncbi:FxLYD domain-containing protein [Halorussus halobius]|uniref:FxLYD domain-containing protein n=1 Tax=Halorussus halobius TaxID=1710537 RepID=UPI001091F678|nr:FxLYD domain-containing protein [Halorussus halobius]
MRRRALLAVVGSAALAGCGGRSDGPSTPETETTTDAETTARATETTVTDDPALEVGDHELVRSNEGSASELASVVGTVRNSTDETVAEATATATFEGGGETLDSASADVSDLAPGGSWSFELVFPGSGEDARAVTDYALDVEVGD